ncbi:MAG: phosphoglucosamine mutase [Alphaproteobacteria bacterium]|nr:phosphoglucosamine mutase [Alphaproteobacteria bacterium]
MTRQYFGTDGIRGKANSFPMTADLALKVAMATSLVLRERHTGVSTDRVVIGKDTRLSCYMLEQALTAGFLSMGLEVILTGPIPTPGIAMLTRSLRCDIGVMISASHNSFEDNGIKLFGADGYKLDDEMEKAIETLLATDMSDALAAPADLGKASRLDDCLGRYAESVKRSLPRGESLDGLKIVVDCANGAAYKVAPQILWELEAQVISIGTAPNGRNINEGCGATDTQQLQKAVIDHGADIGIALDGDADRLIVVDETGVRIDGDQIMAALAASLQDAGKLRGGGLVSTVMSNLGLERFLKARGLNMVRAAVGDRYVLEAMRAGDYNLGGEQSGHIILSDYSKTGDGLLAALQLLSMIKRSGKPASKALNLFTPLPQILRNVRLNTRQDALLDAIQVQDAIAKAGESLNDNGRIVVRASGTEPVIRVMAEGDDPAQVEMIVGDLCAVIEKAAQSA